METLYDLLNSTAFWVVVVAWVFICIAWVERWKPVLGRLGRLFLKPVIFSEDTNPENVPFYPRKFMEDTANGFRNTLKRPFADLIKVFAGWINNLIDVIHNKEHPFRTFGYLLFLASFLFFVLADAIAIANTLAVIGITFGAIPEILTRFDIAVFGGSLLALIIGLVLVFEIRSIRSEFTSYSDRDERAKALSLGIALLVAFLSFLTLIAWALFRLIALGEIESNPVLNGILNWVLYGLVPINSALAAAICFPEAMKGIAVIGILLGWLLIGVLYILDYLATILGSVGPFFVDLIYRIIYVIVDILQWFISTPIQAILWPFKMIAKVFSGTPK
ncbi:MAG: hypothetical protein AB1554_08945 [Chloroflexota bacterium]